MSQETSNDATALLDEAATPPPAPSPLDSSLARLREQIELVLQSVPDNRVEARRIITRELELEPRPEELEAVVRIAHDPVSRGALRDMSCTALALRVLAQRSIRQLMESSSLKSSVIGRAAQLMSGLLETVNTLEEEIHRKTEHLAGDERDHALQVTDALLPKAEPLIAGAILGPRLLTFVTESERGGDVRSTVPSVTEEEAGLIASCCGQGTESDDTPGGLGVTAVALRTVIADDVAEWKRIEGLDGQEEETLLRRQELLDRLKRERTAFRSVTRLLQRRQDTALRAGLRDFSNGLLRVQRSLFSTYLELVSILNAQPGDPADSETGGAEGQAADKLDRLLRESADLDAAAESERAGQPDEDEVCLDALKDLRKSTPQVARQAAGQRKLRRERIRMRVMLSVASVLFLGCVVVYGLAWTRNKVDITVPLDDLPVQLELIDASGVGAMLYAKTSSWTWEDLDESERLDGVNDLGRVARERGFEAVLLTDQDNGQLAVWTRFEGARLSASGS